MIRNYRSSFFARLSRKFFKWRFDWEIMHNIFPHLSRLSNEGYSFESYEQMDKQTKSFDVQNMLDSVERQIEQLPKAYGQCFRHVVHRDICQRLQMYGREAKRHIQPATIDPRFVARSA